jgi:hypothetical protein
MLNLCWRQEEFGQLGQNIQTHVVGTEQQTNLHAGSLRAAKRQTEFGEKTG